MSVQNKIKTSAYRELLTPELDSHSQLHHRRPGPAFILGRLRDRFYMRMLLQVLAQGLAQDAHAAAMHHAHAR